MAWLLIGIALAAAGMKSSAAETSEGFKKIFNGKDLSGWDGNRKLWSVKGDHILGQTTAAEPLKGNTFLIWTNGTVGDFELRCSFRIQPNNDKNFANSGIQYRSKILDPQNWVVGGYQADMEAGETYTGILYEERMTRGIMAARGEKVVWDKDCKKQVTGSLGSAEELKAAIKKGEWNEYVIIANGNHLQHFINGKQMVDVTDECVEKRADRGVLALQLHAGQPMTVEFRDLQLKELAGSGGSENAGLKALQGEWEISHVEANGSAVSEDDIRGLSLTIKGNAYFFKKPDSTDEGTMVVDSSTQPAHMDIHPRTGPDAGQTLLGIVETGPDTFRLCYSHTEGERPAKFSSENSPGCLVVECKRKAP